MYESEPGVGIAITNPDHLTPARELAGLVDHLQRRFPDVEMVFAGPFIDGLRSDRTLRPGATLWILAGDTDGSRRVRAHIADELETNIGTRVIAQDRLYHHTRHHADQAARHLFDNPEFATLCDGYGSAITPEMPVGHAVTSIALALAIAEDAEHGLHKRFTKAENRTELEARRNRAFLQAIDGLDALDPQQIDVAIEYLDPQALDNAGMLISRWVTHHELNAAAELLPGGDETAHERLVSGWHNAQRLEAGITQRLEILRALRPGAGYHLRRLTGLETPADEAITTARHNAGIGDLEHELSDVGRRILQTMKNAARTKPIAEVHDLNAYRAERGAKPNTDSLDR